MRERAQPTRVIIEESPDPVIIPPREERGYGSYEELPGAEGPSWNGGPLHSEAQTSESPNEFYRPEEDIPGQIAMSNAATDEALRISGERTAGLEDRALRAQMQIDANKGATAAFGRAQALKTLGDIGRFRERGAGNGNFSGGKINLGHIATAIADIYTFGAASTAQNAARDPNTASSPTLAKGMKDSIGAKVAGTGAASHSPTTDAASSSGAPMDARGAEPGTGALTNEGFAKGAKNVNDMKSIAPAKDGAAKAASGGKGGSFLGYAGAALSILNAARREPERVRSPLIL